MQVKRRRNLLQRLQAFHDGFAQAEAFVLQHGHLEWDPNARDDWDEDLERLYVDVEKDLRSLSRPRLFFVPSDVPGLRPFTAENPLQARMFFMNPPKALFGHIRALRSKEYLSIKEESFAISEQLVTPKSKRKEDPPRKRSNYVQLEMISAELQRYADEGCPQGQPTQEMIGYRVGISQGEVSKTFDDLPPSVCPGGWRGLVDRILANEPSTARSAGSLNKREWEGMTVRKHG